MHHKRECGGFDKILGKYPEMQMTSQLTFQALLWDAAFRQCFIFVAPNAPVDNSNEENNTPSRRLN